MALPPAILPHLREVRLVAAPWRPFWTAEDAAALGLDAAHRDCEVRLGLRTVCEIAVSRPGSCLLHQVHAVSAAVSGTCGFASICCGKLARRCNMDARCVGTRAAVRHQGSLLTQHLSAEEAGLTPRHVCQVHVDVLGCKAFQAAELSERLRAAGLLPRLRALCFACHRWVGPVRRARLHVDGKFPSVPCALCIAAAPDLSYACS